MTLEQTPEISNVFRDAQGWHATTKSLRVGDHEANEATDKIVRSVCNTAEYHSGVGITLIDSDGRKQRFN